ncbi:MAG: hypothetical protein NVSMB19_04990 [Vulcanimicrobiaceae bacterium]
MITLAVTYVFRPDAVAEAEAHLRELIVATRREPGCRTYDVNRSNDDPRAFLLYEQYVDEAAVAAHRASPHFERFGKNGIQTLAESRVATLYTPFA